MWCLAVSSEHFVPSPSTVLDVGGGIINIDIGYLGMHIFSEVKDLCAKTQCPIPKHKDLELVYVEKLPSFIPPGNYDATITVTSVEGASNTQLFCMKVKLNVQSSKIIKHTQGGKIPSSSVA